ncbi:OmpW/AlkL family protein [Acinetobacter nectaris]|uniref:OmpW/AlkL family protein n=1 Tax=Acinetobacter nectaris TaxID=1219382 RepID=UPI001F1737FD|nr:OmpW family outer membrane protein [Acinetobacter nectaris]MCF8998887.1 OmpW family protein [Acinetobacter nectaris]MCF9027520.1 OmpW family protein [Acinetobacter nectaris]
MNKLTYMIAPVALALVSAAAHAETTDGKTIAVSAGWAHIMPQGSKQGVYSTSNVSFLAKPEPNSGFDLEKTDTAEFKIDYLVNDNVSLGMILGVPPRLDIKGEGSLLGGGLNLDKFSKVGDIKVYSPVITGKYHFGAVTNKFRPYIGAGLMYAHFSDLKLDSGIQNDPLLKVTHGSITNVKVKDAIAPVAFLGADYNVNKDWFITASVSYVQLDTHASLNVSGVTNTGAYKVQGDTKIEINPIVTYLGFGFRF